MIEFRVAGNACFVEFRTVVERPINYPTVRQDDPAEYDSAEIRQPAVGYQKRGQKDPGGKNIRTDHLGLYAQYKLEHSVPQLRAYHMHYSSVMSVNLV